MIFEQVLSLLTFSRDRSNNNRKKKKLFLLPPSREEAIRLALEEAAQLSESRQYKQAIQTLENAIKEGQSNERLLLQKAIYLSKDKQISKAKPLLKTLSKSKECDQIREAAKTALKTVKHLEAELFKAKCLLIKSMHALASERNQQLAHTPQPDQLTPEQDVALIVRKEVAELRNRYRFELALDLLDCASSSNIKSSWLTHQKALTLREIGRFQAAQDLWDKLLKTEKKEKLREAIQQSLKTLDKNKEKFAKERPLRFLRHCKAIAEDHKWTLQHLPEQASGNKGINPRQLALEEAKAALRSNQPALCVALAEANGLYHANNRQALLLQAEALTKLEQPERAREIWKELARTKDDKYAQRARTKLGRYIAEQAIKHHPEGQAKKALTYYIKQHLDDNINPEYIEELDQLLLKIRPQSSPLGHDSALKKYQLKLTFNTFFVGYLEEKLSAK